MRPTTIALAVTAAGLISAAGAAESPAWTRACREKAPMTAPGTRAFMKRLATYVLDHHRKRAGSAPQALGERPGLWDEARDRIAAVVRETGLKVLVCPEDMSQMAVGKEMIVDRLPEDVRRDVVWREDFWLTDEALSTYVRSAGLFGLEMHSPIMGIGNGIPATVCRFAEQTSKGFMWRDIGLGDWLFDFDKEEEIPRLVPAVLAMANDPAGARALPAAGARAVRPGHGFRLAATRAMTDHAARRRPGGLPCMCEAGGFAVFHGIPSRGGAAGTIAEGVDAGGGNGRRGTEALRGESRWRLAAFQEAGHDSRQRSDPKIGQHGQHHQVIGRRA